MLPPTVTVGQLWFLQDALEQLGWEAGHPAGHSEQFLPRVIDFGGQRCHFGVLLLNDDHPAYSRVMEVFLVLFSIPDEH